MGENDDSMLSQESDSKYSAVSMDMTLTRTASESSPELEKKSFLSDSGEIGVANAFINPNENISATNNSDLEKFGQFEQKIEELRIENSSLKVKIKELIDEEKYNAIQVLKDNVKEVCEEKLKLEKEKGDL